MKHGTGLDNIQLGQLEDIKEVNGMRIELLPACVIELQVEIISHHPELMRLLQEGSQDDNYSPEIYYGIIAAYCGIVLDGAYNQEYLIDQLTKALVGKRSVVSVRGALNIAKIPKELLQTYGDDANGSKAEK